MNPKKTILAVFLLFIVSNLLTTGWYALTDSLNYVPFRRQEPNYFGLLLNHLIFVSGLVYLLHHLLKDSCSKMQAFAYGVVISAIMFIPTGLVIRSIWLVDFDLAFVLNTIAHLMIGGILGFTYQVVINFKKFLLNSVE